MHVLIQLQNSNWSTKKNKVKVKFNLTPINIWCINYNQYIQNKIKNKLHMKTKYHARFKLEEKTIEVLKRIKAILSTL